MSQMRHHVGMLDPGRIGGLSDGVFAIVMTLLVFDITFPDVPPEQLAVALLALWPKFLGYAVSFTLLGIYWLGHRTQMHFIRYADANLHWINILFFACSAFVPFSTGLLSRYPGEWLAIAIYGGNLIVIGLSLYWHWMYAVKDFRLVDEDIPATVVRYGAQRCLLAPLGYFVAILLGVINPLISLVVCALVPFLYIVPAIQRRWLHFASR